MKKLCTVAIVSLAALGVGATQASAWCHCCCGVKVCCKQPNAFSPPCCYPCGKWWPPCYGFNAPGPNLAMGCSDCGSGMMGPMISPSPVPSQMPPATGAPPNYMPPAPTEVGGPQAGLPAGPTFPFALANRALPMQPAGFAPANAGYYPPMGIYPGYGAPPMAPGYGPPMPQGYGPPMVQGYGPPMPQGYGPPLMQVYGPPMPQGYGPPLPQGYAMPPGAAPFGMMGQQ
jgi:hypothetical protein